MSNGNYSIYIIDNGEKPLYVAGHPTACVTGATIEEKLNDAGQLNFVVPCSNPHYDLISERKKVVVYQGAFPIWRGFIVSYSKNFHNDMKVTCIGELSYLNDTIQPQARYQNMTPKKLFKAYVDEHNRQSEEKFLVGRVTVTDPNDSVYRYTNYDTTLSALRDDLCDSLKGYLRIRHVGNKRYLDLVKIEDYGSLCGQFIEFGKNLLDYTEGVTANDIATACLPLGAMLDSQVVNGLDAYTTISSVNDGVDYVQNSTAVANYGMIKKVVKWDNVSTPSTLKSKAEAWLTTNQYANITLDISALDLSVLNVYSVPKKWKDYGGGRDWESFGNTAWQEISENWGQLSDGQEWTVLSGKKFSDLNKVAGNVDAFKVGDTVMCFALPYGMATVFPIYNKTTYLQDPTQTKITLSASALKTFTEMTLQTTRIQPTTSETAEAYFAPVAEGQTSDYAFTTNKITKTSALVSCNVKVTGTITSGVVFILPEGFRPTSAITCVGILSGASAVMSVATNGEVSVSASGSSVELNLTFNLE